MKVRIEITDKGWTHYLIDEDGETLASYEMKTEPGRARGQGPATDFHAALDKAGGDDLIVAIDGNDLWDIRKALKGGDPR